MTKDRRLGRGLAALLGSPLEEGQVVDGTVLSSHAGMSSNAGSNRPTSAAAHTAPKSSDESPDAASLRIAEGTERQSNTERVTGAVPIHANEPRLRTLELSVYEIDNNPFQPRRKFNEEEIAALAESLKEHKQLQPVLVRRVGDRYQLISGERRLRATIHAGLKTIRAEVRQADDRLVAELAIVENLQRKDLDAIEKALSFKRYITEHKCTQDELAQRLKIDRSSIANMMRLLELPDSVTDAVQRDEVSAGHAKALLSLGSTREQVTFLKKIREEGWSVRETEARVAEAIAAAAASEEGFLGALPRRKATKSDLLASLENEMKMSLGTRVDISQTSRGRGRITIHFTSIEEFERLKQLLANDQRRKAA